MADENLQTNYVEFVLEHRIDNEELIARTLAEESFPIGDSQVYSYSPYHDHYEIRLPNKSINDTPDIDVRNIGGEATKRSTLIRIGIGSLKDKILSQLKRELNKLRPEY